MISDEQFRKTEGRIYRYYKALRQIDKLESNCQYLEQQRDEIFRDIKESNVTIDPELNMSIAISERVQTSPSGMSLAERETINQIDRLLREWKETRHKILKNHSKVRNIKKEIKDIEDTIGKLDEESKLFVELKYGSDRKLSNLEIANRIQEATKLFISESTVRRKKKEIVEQIYKWNENESF